MLQKNKQNLQKSTTELAPVVLFVYNRPAHTASLIESLQKNKEFEETHLYIFLDAPKNDSQTENVRKTREIIRQIKGCKKITIKENKTNQGLANSIILGISKVLKTNDSIIVLEDDLLVSPNFLSYMNLALTKYKNHENIFSISGYCPPTQMPVSFTEEVFLYPRVSSWGWATWANRWRTADWQVSTFASLLKDKKAQQKFNSNGQDRFPMLVKQQFGYINSWAIRFDYTGFLQNGKTVYPRISKTVNNGADGSGQNVGKTNTYDVEIDKRNFISPLPENPTEISEISYRIQQTYKKSFARKLIHFFLIRFPKSFFAKL